MILYATVDLFSVAIENRHLFWFFWEVLIIEHVIPAISRPRVYLFLPFFGPLQSSLSRIRIWILVSIGNFTFGVLDGLRASVDGIAWRGRKTRQSFAVCRYRVPGRLLGSVAPCS